MQKSKTLDLDRKETYRVCRDWTKRAIDFLERVGLNCEELERARMPIKMGGVLYFKDVLSFLDHMASYLEEAYSNLPIKVKEDKIEVKEDKIESNPLPLIRSPDVNNSSKIY